MVVFYFIFSLEHDLHYLIFMGRLLDNYRKKLTSVGIVISASMNNMDIVNNFGIVSEYAAINCMLMKNAWMKNATCEYNAKMNNDSYE